MSLQGSNVVVIGGSSGMGFAAARLAKQQGANVTIASRSSEKLRQAAHELGGVKTVAADVTRQPDVQAIFADVDRLDHVFVTVGRMLIARVVDGDLSILQSDVEQRFWAQVFVVRAAAPKMTAGSITLLSGQYGSRPAPGSVVTGAMDAAIESLARGLALELAPIRVNAVAPGLIDTPLLAEYRDDLARWAETGLPVKRMGLADEVAQSVVFLMTNGFVTGEVVHIDGGGRLA